MSIVITNVSVVKASAPSLLQKTGAFVSQGATTLTAGTYSLLTQVSDLTPLLVGAKTITSMTWASSIVTVTVSSGHGIPTGDVVQVIISGVTPNAYNGTFSATATSSTVFTYALASNPGTVTTQGAIILEDSQELAAMTATFFSQGNTQAVYVLELGTGTTAQGVTALAAYIAAPTLRFYSYLVPATWGNEATFPTMAANYSSPTSKQYFFVSTTISNYTSFVGIKSCFVNVVSPSAPTTEFSTAAAFYVTLNYAPSATNLVTPLGYAYTYGTTAYSTLTGAQITALNAANVNYIGTGAEGGISQTLIMNGVTNDGYSFNYWYAIDWVQIQSDLYLAAAVINGSNNALNPLYYNQNGIKLLQQVAQQVMNNGITFGLILAPATVNAIPFSTYVAQNPSDYNIGKYSGLSVSFTPQRGFQTIVYNIVVSSIPV